MTFEEHRIGMMLPNLDNGCEFNERFAEDRQNSFSLSEDLEKFQEKTYHVQHDDFSGLTTSELLENPPYTLGKFPV